MTYDSPLAGVHVLEIAEGWPAPMCTKLLADLGATVVKVEVPQGDRLRDLGDAEQSAWAFAIANDGKTVLQASDVTPEEIQRMADRSDVLVVDRRAAASLGVEALLEDSGRLVCEFTDFGNSGPWAGYAGNDMCLQAATGVMATTGELEGDPLRTGIDFSAAVGALYGAIGVLAALVERHQGPRSGKRIEVSLYDCLASTLTHFAARVLSGAPPLRRLGNQGPNTAPWNMFQTADSRHVVIIAGNDGIFRRLAHAMDQPSLCDDPRFSAADRRYANRDALTPVIQSWVGALDVHAVVERLQSAGVPVSAVMNIEDVVEEPHSILRGLVATKPHLGRQSYFPGSPLLKWARTAPSDAVPGGDPRGVRSQGELAGNAGPGAGVESGRRPLEGFRILDAGSLTAGPLACRILAHLGAEVVKIEPPEGENGRSIPPMVEGESAFFLFTNTEKKSVGLDLSSDAGKRSFEELIARSDALIENQSPGALSRKGIGPEALLGINPDLVYTSVTGYGYEGPLGGLRAYDTVIQAATGVMSLTGDAGGEPLKTGISSADILGALAAAVSTVAALVGRVSGQHRGGHVDVAMYDVCVWSTQTRWPEVLGQGAASARAGNGHAFYSPHGIFTTLDGRVAVACESDAQWRELVKLLGEDSRGLTEAELLGLTRPERVARREGLRDLLGRFCALHSSAAVVALLQQRGVPCAPLLEVEEALSSEHALARGVRRSGELRNEGGRIDVLAVPVRIDGVDNRGPVHAPRIGEHNAEFGLSVPQKSLAAADGPLSPRR